MAANSFWGGFAEALGPAIAGQQESSLKKKVMEMQMLQYQAQQQKAASEAEQAQRQQGYVDEYVNATDPAVRTQALINAAVNKGDFAGAAALSKKAGGITQETLNLLKANGIDIGGGGVGGGQGSGMGGQVSMVPSINAEGQISLGGHYESPPAELKVAQAFLLSKGFQPGTPEWEEKLAAYLYGKGSGRGAEEVAADLYGTPRQQPQQPQQPQQQQGRMPQQMPQEAGIAAVGPDGQPIMFDNQATKDEYEQRGFPLGPNRGAQQPQTPQFAGGGGGSGNPLDRANARELRQKTAEAGATAGAGERAKTLPESTQKILRETGSMRFLAGQMGKAWRPEFTGLGAQGPLQKLKKSTGIGLAPGEADYDTTAGNLRQAILRGDIGSAQTSAELLNALDRIGDPGMTDEMYRSRLGVLIQLLDKADETAIGLATTPMGEVGGYLKERRQTQPDLAPGASRVPGGKEQAGSQAGGVAPDGTVIRMKDGSSRVKQGGRWAPYGGK